MAATSRRPSLENEAFLRSRVKELEQEVTRLKRRLDELRKAKNTTVIKREKEMVEVKAPSFGTRRESKSQDTNLHRPLEGNEHKQDKFLQELKDAHCLEIKQLKQKHEDEIQKILNKDAQKDCGHTKEIQDLKHAISDLQGDNAAILVENDDLKEKISALLEELSVKEAKKCEMEKDIEKKMDIKWQKMYQEWMAATEAKLQELQQANAFLRRMIDAGKPRGRDPTGQDNS